MIDFEKLAEPYNCSAIELLKKLYIKDDFSIRKISFFLNVSEGAIRKKLKNSNIKIKKIGRPKVGIVQIFKHYGKKEIEASTAVQFAEEAGYTEGYVQRVAKSIGYKFKAGSR